MKDIEIIDQYLNRIVKYYSSLKGNDNILDFLRRELYCINNALDLVDLSLLPLSLTYIEECRNMICQALGKNDFLEITRKLSVEIIDRTFKVKKYTEMSKLEQAVFDSFLCLFPRKIESSDLLIEVFTDNLLDCSVNNKDFLSILYKHFNKIIN